MKDTIQIRRYPNRRYYARNTSQYVSLQEIENLIRDGHEVEIRDTQTDEDLTRAMLTKIILERNPEKMDLFPTPMLYFILRSNEMMAGFLRDYFQHSLTYLEYLQRHGATAPVHWVKAWLDGIRGRPPEEPSADNRESRLQRTDERADELTRHVARLEQRIRQLEGDKTNSKSDPNEN